MYLTSRQLTDFSAGDAPTISQVVRSGLSSWRGFDRAPVEGISNQLPGR